MTEKQINTDLVVVGGGMAGLVAAIAAARMGRRVVLVQDRPVLGGNASSEIRCWVGGAQGHTTNRFAREGGILGELLIEQVWRNPECSPPVWNGILLDAVMNEPNLELLLDTAVDAVTMADASRVAGVSAYCSVSQTRYEISAPLFVDASGDSIIGGLAGAEYRIGKESRDEFGEPTAPPEADPRCLGASVYFYTRDRGRPVPFVAPDFAIDLSKTWRVRNRGFDGLIQGCRLWWLEYGGELDTIADSAEIKRVLTGVAYGFWDYLKNSGKFPETRNLDLEWMGPVPGKRESLRLMGPHILTEHDLYDQSNFPDGCATGGWTIDHHPPRGVFDDVPPSRHIVLPGPYNIPLRCLFSRNITNLFMAGRNISVSNVAFGSTRLMGTGAVCGQAVGTAAALCLERDITPAELATDAALVERFRQILLREDQHIIGLPNRDDADLARAAEVGASSEFVLKGTRVDRKAEPAPVDRNDAWLMVPVTTGELKHVDLMLTAKRNTTMTVELRRNDRRRHYFPNELLATRRVGVTAGQAQWVRIPADLSLEEPCNVWVVVKRNRNLAVHPSPQRVTGVISSLGSWREWPDPRLDLPAFRIAPPQPVYQAGNVTNGFARPYVMPNLWMSDERVGGRSGGKPWVELRWPQPQRVRQVRLYLSHDVDMQIPTMLMTFPFRAVPTVLKDFSVSAAIGGRLKSVARVRENHLRMVVIDLEEPIETDRLRVTAEATWGAPRAELFEVRVY